jgi:hypothetical protein
MGRTVPARQTATEGNEVANTFHRDDKDAAVEIWRDVVEHAGVDDGILAKECQVSAGYFSKVASGAQGCLLALVYRVGRKRPELRREFLARLAEREGLDLADIAAEQLAITAIRFLRARRRTFPRPTMAKASVSR